jgi:hypothetical protein
VFQRPSSPVSLSLKHRVGSVRRITVAKKKAAKKGAKAWLWRAMSTEEHGVKESPPFGGLHAPQLVEELHVSSFRFGEATGGFN